MNTKICSRKTCKSGGMPQILDKFSKNKNQKDGYNIWCKQCKNEYLKNYYRTNDEYRERQSSRRLERDYGLGVGEYKRMLDRQSGVCAICKNAETAGKNGKAGSLSVDHNHANRNVRGLLCHRCNTMIGLSSESVEILREAANYLEKWNTENTP